jgi:hypothetical protein
MSNLNYKDFIKKQLNNISNHPHNNISTQIILDRVLVAELLTLALKGASYSVE